MNNRFIPSFHTTYTAEQKLTREWCNEALKQCWYQSNNKSLLHDKNVTEIDQYASGKFDMTPYKKMFKSLKKSIVQKEQNPSAFIKETDTTGLDWSCFSIIPPKINSAISIIQKIPVEISCTALDPLAQKKKKEDIEFLKNKPALEQELQSVADNLDIGDVDLGTTKYSSVPYSDSPYGFDLNNPDELDVFVNLLYSLDIEASFETVLQIFWELKKINQVRLQETRDQFYYGVSVNRTFQSAVTGLPDIEHEHPANVYCPDSSLPDYADTPYRFVRKKVTVMELFNYFGDEIGDENSLLDIINNPKTGYCACKKLGKVYKIPYGNFDTYKVDLVFCEIKSVDWIGISSNKKSRRGFKSVSTDDKATKLWAQNTYTFWWLEDTDYIFGIERLGFAHREEGQESFQNFVSNIYKSQPRSCVENCIGENKKGQIADIKMQHALIKSLPAGKYIDLRFIRGALTALKKENDQYTIQTLIDLAFEQNMMIGDTEGFDGKNDGQFKPFMDIAGGMKTEIEGYLRVMAEANRNIEAFSGINQALTGQAAPNPDSLVGVEKLRLNASLNSLFYATEAIEHQCQQIGYLLSNYVKQAIEAGGATKKAMIDLIGSQKVGIIDGLADLSLHTIGVKISVSQREEERIKFEQDVYDLKAKGVLSKADEFMLNSIPNPKDKRRLLAIREKQFMQREELRKQQDAANQQALMAQAGQNKVAEVNSKVDGDIRKIYAKGDVDSKHTALLHELGLNSANFKALIDRQQLADRQKGQIEKSVTTLNRKAQLEEQKAL